MYVKYTGFGEIISEYNGKLVMFNSKHRVKNIEQAAYDELQRCQMVEACHMHVMSADEVSAFLEREKVEKIVSRPEEEKKHPDWYIDTIKFSLKHKRLDEAKKMLEEALILYPENKRVLKMKEFMEQ